MTLNDNNFDLIIIGGGITGAGTARDCSMRGLKVLLLEKDDYATGATGRNHGLLHSGARYAVYDHESAEECIKENFILRKIAHHCVEEHDGLFITLPEDDLAYQQVFVDACQSAGIHAEIIDPQWARRMEPSVNPQLIGAVKVPDGSIDPFRLTLANMIDARRHGAVIKTYHEVTDLILEGSRVVGVKTRNTLDGTLSSYYAPITVNAGGIWGHGIAQKAGIQINMCPSKGSLLIFGHRVNNMVLNRCRKPANADILVPGDTICVIGTTSSQIPYEEIDQVRVTPDEVDLLLSEGSKLAPDLAQIRILRAYAGVRPLVSADNDPSGRNISRGIVLLDHDARDGAQGFITITGGKLMTYRLMAEKTSDLVCQKLHRSARCQTAEVPLPGSQRTTASTKKQFYDVKPIVAASVINRHGDMATQMHSSDLKENSLVCECENITVSELKYAIKELNVQHLSDLRKRTRLGMGTCQGELCACRAACILGETQDDSEKALQELEHFLSERWIGTAPICWGAALKEAEYTQWVYGSICNMK